MPSIKAKKIYPEDVRKLYWCTTKEHGDDALIVAATVKQAEEALASSLGCDLHEVTASLVLNLKTHLGAYELDVGPVEDDILEACSATIAKIGPSRVVYLNGRCYVEGILDFVMEEARRQLGPEGLKEFLEGK